MGIRNIFSSRGVSNKHKLNDEYISTIAKYLGLRHIGADNNNNKIYVVEDTNNLNKIGKYQFLKDKIVYIDLSPVLDKYGVIKDYKELTYKETNLDTELSKYTKGVVAYKKCAIPININYNRLDFKIVNNLSGQIKISDNTSISIKLSDNYVNTKIWKEDNGCEINVLYKIYNGTDRDIPCLVYSGAGNYIKSKPTLLRPGQSAFISGSTLSKLDRNDLKFFWDGYIEHRRNTLKAELGEVPLMDSKQRDLEKSKLLDKYSLKDIKTNFGNLRLPTEPFNLEEDSDLIIKYTYNNLYEAINKSVNPHWSSRDEDRYTLLNKLVDYQGNSVGYRAECSSRIYSYKSIKNITMEEALILAEGNKILNASLVVSESKRPYVRCNTELPKISV